MKKKMTKILTSTMAASLLLTPLAAYASPVQQQADKTTAVSLLEDDSQQNLLDEVAAINDAIEKNIENGATSNYDILQLLDEAEAKLNILMDNITQKQTMADPDAGSYQDISSIFMEQMRTNGLRMVYMYQGNAAGAGLYFASQVKTGGAWDYKLKYGVSKRYKFKGKIVAGEDIGNIHYGFVGRYLFPTSLLKTAAGAYQIYSGTAHAGWYKSYFDDPKDQAMIVWGINLYAAQ